MKAIERTIPFLDKWQERQVAMSYLHDEAKSCARTGKATKLKKLISIEKFLFPGPDCSIGTSIFEGYWESGKRKEAIKVYEKIGKPFWLAEKVGRYYEKKGRIKEAMTEYEWLMTEYKKMKDFLPLPQGPVELFKLGKWYLKTNPQKAKKYLALYLSTEERWKTDPAFRIPYKSHAQRLLSTS